MKRSAAESAQGQKRSSKMNWKGLEVIGMGLMKVISRKSQWQAVENRETSVKISCVQAKTQARYLSTTYSTPRSKHSASQL
jgi:hypothetical protein